MTRSIEVHDAALWVHHMRQGDFAAAWRVSDAILNSHASSPGSFSPRHLRPVWRGSPLAGKRVLVRCHHGLGDTFQFIRYAPLIKSIAQEVIVGPQPSLAPLMLRVPGVDRVAPLDEGDAETAYDVDVEVMELPYIFRSTPSNIPSQTPYIHVEPAGFVDNGRLAVGLVWKAGDWDSRRSVPVSLLEPLMEIAGISVHILQRGPGLQERPDGFGILSGSEDVLESAQIIRALDLVLTVDTMLAHLAGALGIPVWLMLQADADWRWMERRKDSPWYPGMRLFRQEVEGDWTSVITGIVHELRRSTSRRPAGRKKG